MKIAYAAQTRGCTFHVDGELVCRAVHPLGDDAEARRECTEMQRCVGAQYVGSLDPFEQRLVVDAPAVGAPMLFAFASEHGRIQVVRTQPVTALAFTEDVSFVPERRSLDAILPSTLSSPRAGAAAPLSDFAADFGSDESAASSETFAPPSIYDACPVPTPRVGDDRRG